MIDPKRLVCTITILLFLCSTGYAQLQANPDHLLHDVDLNMPRTHVALAGESTLSTYGAAVSFPIYWIEDRIKAVPIFGLMWQNFVDEGFNVRPAAGAKLMYYFQRKASGTAPINSFYAGLGGMGTINRFFGNSIHEYSRGGVFAGYDFSVGETFRLAPELFLGANESGKLRAEIGLVLYFGR